MPASRFACLAILALAESGGERRLGQGGQRFGKMRLEVEVEVAFDQGSCKSERGTAQRERILVAARLHADGKDAGQRIETLGDGEHPAESGLRQCASPALRGR